jgi:hypothetical protein
MAFKKLVRYEYGGKSQYGAISPQAEVMASS